MIRISSLSLPLGADADSLKKAAAAKLGVTPDDFLSFELLRRSVDSRDKGDIRIVSSVLVSLDGDEKKLAGAFPDNEVSYTDVGAYALPELRRVSAERPAVVGFGPAGMFAALMLARAGLRPFVIERGADADERTKDVLRFSSGGALDKESNVQFGEGGAGTFSDGKLNTGIKDPRIREVLKVFASHGAPADILVDAHPHIGTDRLPGTVKSIRKEIIDLGGEVRFRSRLEEIVTANKAVYAIRYVDAEGEKYFTTDTVVLAIGHSARDTVRSLWNGGLRMERKAFSIGLRIEHPQELINKAQYGAAYADPRLPAAEYKLANHPPHGRGAYTFCMCPGGTVVAAASEEGGVVTNGMSPFARDGVNANAAILVGVEPDRLEGTDVFAGAKLQLGIERAAFGAGGGTYAAPAQKLGDFLAHRASSSLGSVAATYSRGVVPSDVRRVLPQFVTDEIETAIRVWDRKIRSFALPDAVLTAPETRSTSPIRMPRDPFGRAQITGVYPAGEGAGYAGGIVSAAVDGIKTAESIISAADYDD